MLYEGYLTEKKLGDVLNTVFPDVEWVHNKTVPNSGLKTRPDFRSDELMLIYEYDGDSHYTKPDVIIRDQEKDKVYGEMGYTVYRIPYFIQLKLPLMIALGFDKGAIDLNESHQSDYKDGFISKKAVTPAYFCSYGVSRFQSDLETFCEMCIVRSMINLVDDGKDGLVVFPVGLDLSDIIDKVMDNYYAEEDVLH